MRELEYRPESSLGLTSGLSAEVIHTTPPDLVTWLREQIDEDERVAQSVDPKSVGWLADYGEDCALPGAGKAVRSFAGPARVLREVEAKRRVIEVVESWRHLVVEDCWYTCPAATEQREGEVSCNDNWEPGRGPCNCGVDHRRHAILGPLALPYADRPGYREEWRP